MRIALLLFLCGPELKGSRRARSSSLSLLIAFIHATLCLSLPILIQPLTMPKIISNSIVSSSDNRDDQQQRLHSYYCLCSEFILVIGKETFDSWRRNT